MVAYKVAAPAVQKAVRISFRYPADQKAICLLFHIHKTYNYTMEFGNNHTTEWGNNYTTELGNNVDPLCPASQTASNSRSH